MNPRIGDKWLSVREAAELAGVPVHTIRRRVKAIDKQNPKLGLLRRPGLRNFEVSAQALQRALTTDPGLGDSELDAITMRVTQIEDRLNAMRKSHKQLKTQVNQLQLRFDSAPAM